VLESLFALPPLAEDSTRTVPDIMHAAAKRPHSPRPRAAAARNSRG
jgi:hypothetical protein